MSEGRVSPERSRYLETTRGLRPYESYLFLIARLGFWSQNILTEWARRHWRDSRA